MKKITFFKKLVETEKSSLKLIECCKCMRFQEFAASSYVVRVGDPANALYIILEGQVSVQKPAALKDHKTRKKSPSKIIKSLAIDLAAEETAVLGPGACFGEMALMNDRLRNASIQCQTILKTAILLK